MAAQSEVCDLFQFITFAVIIGTLCLFGLLGNGTAFLVLRRHATETATISILQALAVADSVLLLCSAPLYIIPGIHFYLTPMDSVYSAWEHGKDLVWPLAMIAHTCTIWLTVMVAITRYVSVCSPLQSRAKQGLRSTKIQLALVVTFAVIYNIPRFFEHYPIRQAAEATKANASSGNNQAVTVILGDSRVYQIVYSIVFYFPVMFVIPLISLTYLNVRLIQAIQVIKERRESLTGHRHKNDHITLCIIGIICVFILCQTPALINQIFWAINVPICGEFHYYYTKISDVLVVLNSSCNFIIYCLFGRSFRKIFIDTVCQPFRQVVPKKGVTQGDYDIPMIEVCDSCKTDYQAATERKHAKEAVKTKACACKTLLSPPGVTTEGRTSVTHAVSSENCMENKQRTQAEEMISTGPTDV